MPPTSQSKSGDTRNKRDGVVVCKCIASTGTKIDSPEDDPKDSADGISQNPSENVGVKITVLNLAGQGLKSLPETEDLANVNVLNLSNNDISELPSSLKSARFLRVLNVSSNKLTEFPKVLTYGLHILRKLNLSHNAIRTLPRPTCYQHLTELSARDCELSEFPYWILYEMHFLEILDLSSNAIFCKMALIEHRPFNQSCNNFKRVNFSNTYLSDGHLQVISLFKQLQYLDVSNYAHKFPNSFSGFGVILPPGLKVLKATNVRMVDKLDLMRTRVEKVNLSHNSLVLLNEVNISVYIRFLVLSDCYLAVLPENFGDMIHLEYLNLSKNDVCSLPESFANLADLVHLDLYHNSFRDFPSEQLLPLKKITCFDMCMNPVDVPPYPLGEEAPSYERLRATLRSALTYPRNSGKNQIPDPEPECSDGYYSSTEEDYYEDDEDFEASNGSSSLPRTPIVGNCDVEEEDWDAIDENSIYNDATTSLYMGGLNRTGDLFAGSLEEDLLQMNLRRVPARIRDSPLFYYRTSYAVLPHPNSGCATELETVVEGQFDDE